MKTIHSFSGLLLSGILTLATSVSYAQDAGVYPDAQKYQIRIVKEENGKSENIDHIFNSKAELDTYLNDQDSKINGIKKPLLAGPRPVADKRMKSVNISEQNLAEKANNTILEITYNNFSAQERAAIIQELLNRQDQDFQIGIHKEILQKCVETEEGQSAIENIQPPTSVSGAEQTSLNLTDVKVFPNPAQGQFHVAFTVLQLSDIQLSLTDASGRLVYGEVLNNYSGKFEKQINTEKLAAGSYVLNISVGDEKRSTQVVMQ